jgi:hypothetical protein
LSGSTVIIPKVKTLIETIPKSSLTIVFDPSIPPGTRGRVEIAPDKGFIQPYVIEISVDPELKAEVYVQLDGYEKKMLEVDESKYDDIDVDESIGEVLASKLILVGETKVETTTVRRITLYYSGGVYEYR